MFSVGSCGGSSHSPPPLVELLVEQFDTADDWSFTRNAGAHGTGGSASAEIRDGGLFLSANQGSISCANATATRTLPPGHSPLLSEFQLLIEDLWFGVLAFGGGTIRVDFANMRLMILLRVIGPGVQGSLSFHYDGQTSTLTIDGIPVSPSSFEFSVVSASQAEPGRIEIVADACSPDAFASAYVRLTRLEIRGR